MSNTFISFCWLVEKITVPCLLKLYFFRTCNTSKHFAFDCPTLPGNKLKTKSFKTDMEPVLSEWLSEFGEVI